MDFPILTQDLVARIMRAENAMTLSRLENVQRLAGNPLGVEVREFGHVLATMMRKHPEHWWNRVRGITPGDENLLDEILAWYRSREVQPSFEIVPPHSSEPLLRALAARGFFQSSFMAVMYGVPNENQLHSSGIAVREQEDLEIFLEVAAQTGFLQSGDEKFWKQVAQAEFSTMRCYVAFVEGIPAAHALMNISESTAVFGFAATLEKYRGRGCQSALLRARLCDSALARCNLMTVQANPGSGSQRNIERAGLRVAYSKALWTAL